MEQGRENLPYHGFFVFTAPGLMGVGACHFLFFIHCSRESWLSPDGRPATRPATLMSSSKSGQCTPSPCPTRRQFFRSAGVPCCRRGYQARGTVSVRPSESSTTRLSSVTATDCAKTASASRTKVFIPTPPYFGNVFLDKPLNLVQLRAAKTGASFESYGIQPIFGFCLIPLNVDMRRFLPIA